MLKLLVGGSLTLLLISLPVCVAADEAEKSDKLAREAAEAYTKGLLAGDLAGVMKVADVPWCHDARKLIKDRRELEKTFGESFKRPNPFAGAKVVIREVGTLEQLRLKKSGPPAREVSLGEVLGKDDRVAYIELVKDGRAQTMWLGVRLEKGKAKVVGIVD